MLVCFASNQPSEKSSQDNVSLECRSNWSIECDRDATEKSEGIKPEERVGHLIESLGSHLDGTHSVPYAEQGDGR